jgi:NAD(P)-dependent dehydrogenase (short-subunit alcohol dehydrogenase family)
MLTAVACPMGGERKFTQRAALWATGEAEMTRFRDRHIVVTGGASGIGRAIAGRLTAEGATLSLLDRDVEALERVAAELDAHAERCDVRDRAQVDGAVARAAGARGAVHVLVAATGIGGPNDDGPDDRFDDIVQTNLAGTYYCVRAALRHLAPGPDARHVIVFSSILARIGVPGHTAYSASKAGLLGLVRSLAAELAPQNVQVNAICPGWVDTDMAVQGLDVIAQAIGGTREEAYAVAMREVPLARMNEPEEIAGTVAWLLSPDARGVTGQAIDQNGGAWMG